MSLDNVINLNITRSAPAVSRQGFGLMLILGPNATGWDTDRARSYSSAAALLDDGFTTDNPEYKSAVKAFSQAVRPQSVLVGLMGAKVAQVKTLTPDVSVQGITTYTATINGTEFSFESDENQTAEEVVTGLIALINAGDEPATASGTDTLIVTADDAGVPFTLTASDNLDIEDTTDNHGPVEDLAEISAINNDWYALAYTARTSAEIEILADYIESVRKIFIPCSSEAGVIASGATDIASVLKAKALDRTAYLYSGDQANYPDAAWLGRMLPTTPGGANWKFKTLAGITADSLSDTAYTNATGKNANLYNNVGGSGMTEEGKVASGEYIDVIVGVDWIHVNMQADIYQAFLDNDKIPFTDDGINSVVSVMDRRLRLAVQAGILADYEITAPKASAVDPADKAIRHLSGMQFSGTLAGAVNKTSISGFVAV